MRRHSVRPTTKQQEASYLRSPPDHFSSNVHQPFDYLLHACHVFKWCDSPKKNTHYSLPPFLTWNSLIWDSGFSPPPHPKLLYMVSDSRLSNFNSKILSCFTTGSCCLFPIFLGLMQNLSGIWFNSIQFSRWVLRCIFLCEFESPLSFTSIGFYLFLFVNVLLIR